MHIMSGKIRILGIPEIRRLQNKLIINLLFKGLELRVRNSRPFFFAAIKDASSILKKIISMCRMAKFLGWEAHS